MVRLVANHSPVVEVQQGMRELLRLLDVLQGMLSLDALTSSPWWATRIGMRRPLAVRAQEPGIRNAKLQEVGAIDKPL